MTLNNLDALSESLALAESLIEAAKVESAEGKKAKLEEIRASLTQSLSIAHKIKEKSVLTDRDQFIGEGAHPFLVIGNANLFDDEVRMIMADDRASAVSTFENDLKDDFGEEEIDVTISIITPLS